MKLKLEQLLRIRETVYNLKNAPWILHYDNKQIGSLGVQRLLEEIELLPEDTALWISVNQAPVFFRSSNGMEKEFYDDFVIRLSDLAAMLPESAMNEAFWSMIQNKSRSAYYMALHDEIEAQLEDRDDVSKEMIDTITDWINNYDESMFDENFIAYGIKEELSNYYQRQEAWNELQIDYEHTAQDK